MAFLGHHLPFASHFMFSRWRWNFTFHSQSTSTRCLNTCFEIIFKKPLKVKNMKKTFYLPFVAFFVYKYVVHVHKSLFSDCTGTYCCIMPVTDILCKYFKRFTPSGLGYTLQSLQNVKSPSRCPKFILFPRRYFPGLICDTRLRPQSHCEMKVMSDFWF